MPTTKPLSDRKILVVEDETLIAMVMVDFLRDQGAWVIGPVSTVDSAMDAIASSSKIDGAFLDINLNGEASYFVADRLSERGSIHLRHRLSRERYSGPLQGH